VFVTGDRTIEAIQQALDALQAGTLDASAFSAQVRAMALPAALPPRYQDVLLGLLDRLESSALFSGESCSFSQSDLLANVQVWIDKAKERLR